MERPLTGQLLLVGEGDFSLSVALVHHLSQNEATSGHAIISTSIETDESILKHKDAPDNIKWLQHRGVTVYLETDATKLHESSQLMLQRFDRIIFNFPHAGGKSNHKKNRKLLNDFFASSSELLTERGQIMVTLCKGQGGTPADKPMRKWHDSWQVVSMAANASLLLVEVVPFDAAEFDQYKCTGFRSQDNTQGAITHIFEKGTPVQIPKLDNFKCEESYIPGQKYFQEKYSRQANSENCGLPLTVFSQQGCSEIC